MKITAKMIAKSKRAFQALDDKRGSIAWIVEAYRPGRSTGGGEG